MEYCKFHVAAKSKTEEDKPSKTDEEVTTWDKDFVKVDQATLFELILVRPATTPLEHVAGARICKAQLLHRNAPLKDTAGFTKHPCPPDVHA